MERMKEARRLVVEARTQARIASEMMTPRNIGAALADACTNLARAIDIILEHIDTPSQDHD